MARMGLWATPPNRCKHPGCLKVWKPGILVPWGDQPNYCDEHNTERAKKYREEVIKANRRLRLLMSR